MPNIKYYGFNVFFGMDQELIDFFDEYGDYIPSKAGFGREAIKHYIPYWIEGFERLQKFKKKYMNEC